MDLFFSIVIVGFIGIITVFIRNRKRKFRIFKDLGVPGPEPSLITGNLKEINKKTTPQALRDWREKYGKIYGYFLGAHPVLVAVDTDILKQVQIKDFHSFINRPVLQSGGFGADKNFQQHVAAVKDDRWKYQRGLLTPTFTSGKMKQMLPHMNDALEILSNKIENSIKNDMEFDIYEMFKGLTLDVISRTAFGTKTNVQHNSEDPFLLGAKELLQSGPADIFVVASLCFPEVEFLFAPMRKLKEIIKGYLAISHVRNLFQSCLDIIKLRRGDSKNRRSDLLQLMLNAEFSTDTRSVSGEELTAGYESETRSNGASPVNDESKKQKSRGLTEIEVASNTFIFVFAGYETTSTALGYTAHILVNNPNIQEKMRQEILKVQAEDGKIDYSSLSKLKYMDMVFSEVLRFYSPVPFTARMTNKEENYKGLAIPKRTIVQIPIDLLHRDPEYWFEPNQFNPERFAPENLHQINSMAYQPFGGGPRNCIGMRFAQMEAKLALANVLSKYKLIPSSTTETGELQILFKTAISVPKNGVIVKAKKV